MDTTLPEHAVDDLLNYCRNSQHVMNEGRMLAPVLLGRNWRGPRDDYQLVVAIQRILDEEIAQLRRIAGLAALDVDNEGPAEDRLKEYERVGHKQLSLLGLMWAHYIERLDTKKLAAVRQCDVRTIQVKLKAGRAEVAQLLARRALAAVPAAQPNTSHISGNGAADQPSSGNPTDDLSAAQTVNTAPYTPASARVGADVASHTNASSRHTTHINNTQTVIGDNAQVVQGPVTGPVHQIHTQHIYNRTTSTPPATSQTDDSIMFAVMLIAIAGGYWLLQTAPWQSIGALLIISGWRAVANVLHAKQLWSAPASDEDRWWHIGYTALWATLCVWVIVMATRVLGDQAASEYAFGRLILVAWFVAIIGQLSMLGIMEVFLAALRSANPRWPLRVLLPRAAWFWQSRWLILLVAWLPLVVIIVSSFIAPSSIP
jgi:hypothetical protein